MYFKSLFRIGVFSLCALTVAPAWAQDVGYTFTTIAGLAGGDNLDGVGTAARFRYPFGIGIDTSGNLYVTDPGVNTLRKIGPGAVVSTIAGRADYGGDADGQGSQARFSGISYLAVAPDGTVYVCEGSPRIRKITRDGTVAAFAGGTVGGYADGLGSSAVFRNPSGLAVDASGNVYVADTDNHVIRKITPTGLVTTVAGVPETSGHADGAMHVARFNGPRGVAVDAAGNVWVADSENHVIRKITGGVVTTVAGAVGHWGSSDGAAAGARFSRPGGLACDAAGNLYIGEIDGRSVRKLTPSAIVSTLARGEFSQVRSLTVDITGNVYLPESERRCVKKISPAGVVTVLAGKESAVRYADGQGSEARFTEPKNVAVGRDGTMYVADTNSFALRKVTPGGVVTTVKPVRDGSLDAFDVGWPSGVAVDVAGNVFVADVLSHFIYRVTPAGVASPIAGDRYSSGANDGTGSSARLSFPLGIAVDGVGNLYVADSGNHTIRKITPQRVVTTFAGMAGVAGNADGAGSMARFSSPNGVAVAPSGNVFVADTNNGLIRKINPEGVVTTYGGAAARFSAPAGVAVDANENVFVAESGRDTIRKMTPDGTITVVGGEPDFPGHEDGVGGMAHFYGARGVALDRFGHLIVADTYNNTIRRGTMPGAVSPIFTGPSASIVIGVGREAVFSVTVQAVPVPIYRWQRRAAGTSTFVDLEESETFSGVSTPTLRVSSVSIGMSGSAFRCVAMNGTGPESVSTASVLTVVAPPVFTSASSASFQFGVESSFSVKATNAVQYRVSAGSLPAWASLNATTGVITGTPRDTVGSPHTFTLEASNAAEIQSTQSFTLTVNPLPYFTSHPTTTTLVAGSPARLTASAVGEGTINYQWTRNGVPLPDHPGMAGESANTLTILRVQPSDAGAYALRATNASGTTASNSALIVVTHPPTLTSSPTSTTVAAGTGVAFSVAATGSALTYQWFFNGSPLVGATNSTFSIPQAAAAWVGQFSVRVSNGAAAIMSDPALLGLAGGPKLDGLAAEVGSDIVHPSGRIFDQVLLSGSFVTLRADPGQVVRVSYLDLNGDIVQVEFGGAGTMSLKLDSPSGPMLPAFYNQSVSYMRGHASIFIADADETSNVAVFSVGRITAINQSLFRDDIAYDGIADIASISIASRNGKFGSVFTGNASYWDTKGITGIYAPDVDFTGAVVVGDIGASDNATPVLRLKSAAATKVAGGDLAQSNHRPVRVSGISRLEIVAGTNSHGTIRVAQPNQARLDDGGTDVTDGVVDNPEP